MVNGLAKLHDVHSRPYHYNPRQLINATGKIKLYHYQPFCPAEKKSAILIVYAAINRPEILDLFPEQSFIGGLLKNNHNMYLLDWGYPDAEDCDLTLEDYIDAIQAQVEFILSQTGMLKINLLGICQGGLFGLIYAALHKNIENLILISTPINFHTKNDIVSKLLRQINSEKFNEFPGNFSGKLLANFFLTLRPFDLLGKKYLHFFYNIKDEKATERFLQIEKWLHDTPDLAKSLFTEIVKSCYQENKLVKDELLIKDKIISLKNINIPILNIVAKDDHIVPKSASIVLKKLVDNKYYSEKIISGGHIGIYINKKNPLKLPNLISTWLDNQKGV